MMREARPWCEPDRPMPHSRVAASINSLNIGEIPFPESSTWLFPSGFPARDPSLSLAAHAVEMGEVLDGGDHLGGPQNRGLAVSGASLSRGGGGILQRLDDTIVANGHGRWRVLDNPRLRTGT
jgi:hypothetical protein